MDQVLSSSVSSRLKADGSSVRSADSGNARIVHVINAYVVRIAGNIHVTVHVNIVVQDLHVLIVPAVAFRNVSVFVVIMNRPLKLSRSLHVLRLDFE